MTIQTYLSFENLLFAVFIGNLLSFVVMDFLTYVLKSLKIKLSAEVTP